VLGSLIVVVVVVVVVVGSSDSLGDLSLFVDS
jgi:hypothetical protein